jgi:hypothetical protein
VWCGVVYLVQSHTGVRGARQLLHCHPPSAAPRTDCRAAVASVAQTSPHSASSCGVTAASAGSSSSSSSSSQQSVERLQLWADIVPVGFSIFSESSTGEYVSEYVDTMYGRASKVMGLVLLFSKHVVSLEH